EGDSLLLYQAGGQGASDALRDRPGAHLHAAGSGGGGQVPIHADTGATAPERHPVPEHPVPRVLGAGDGAGQVLEQGGGEGADAEGGGGAGTGGGAADPEEGRLERERLAPSDCQDARGPSGGRGGTSPAPPASHRRSPTRKRGAWRSLHRSRPLRWRCPAGPGRGWGTVPGRSSSRR